MGELTFTNKIYNRNRKKTKRWDHIRKRNAKFACVKTDAVKFLLGINFVDKKAARQLTGEIRNDKWLDPTLVMNIRHDAVKRDRTLKKNDSGSTFDFKKSMKHENGYENTYIKKALNEFKVDLHTPKRRNSKKENLQLSINEQNTCIPMYSNKITQVSRVDATNSSLITNTLQQSSYNNSVHANNDIYTKNINKPRVSSSQPKTDLKFHTVVFNVLKEVLQEIQEEDAILQENVEKIIEKFPQKDAKPNFVTTTDSLVSTELHNSEKDAVTLCNKSNKHQQKTETSSKHHSQFSLKKCFLKWVHFTTIEKIERQFYDSGKNRFQKINQFLHQIRQNKCNQTKTKFLQQNNALVATKNFQNKIKIQQDIIKLQKIKLERQDRIILNLKLSKYQEENHLIKETLKNELESLVKHGEAKSRIKAKIIKQSNNLISSEDNDNNKLCGKAVITPAFLLKMHERAKERSIKHEEAKERRRLLEAEKEASKLAEEAARRLESEDEKRKRLEALREKRRIEKLTKLIKERETKKHIENIKKAVIFDQKRILKRFGITPFKRLVELKVKNTRIALKHRKKMIIRSIFGAWRNYTDVMVEKRNQLMYNFYKTHLMKISLKTWRKYVLGERSKYLVAFDWYELKISEKYLYQWIAHVKRQNLIEDTKLKQSEMHYNWHLKWKVLDHWRRLKQILEIEKEIEKRRQRWRLKIWELLPDYTPASELL